MKSAISVLRASEERSWLRILSWTVLSAEIENSFARIAILRGCDRSLSHPIVGCCHAGPAKTVAGVRGPLPARIALLQSCPACLSCRFALFTRGRSVISLVGRTFLSDQNLVDPISTTRPGVRIPHPALYIWPLLGQKTPEPYLTAFQFTKRRIRTFITIPSARNINNTEDPP
jgi:hypothetical protein